MIRINYYGFSFLLILILSAGCRNLEQIGALVPPTVDQDASLPSVRITAAGRSRLLHVRTFGEKGRPVVFLLHGSYSDAKPYYNICRALSDKYYVVAWDQRGCGLSERITPEEFTLASAVEEILSVKSIYAPDRKVTVLGQSWGGGLGTYFTSLHPEMVEQLVIIEPMPLTDKDMQQVFTQIVEFNYTNGSWNNMARQGQVFTPSDHARLDYRARMVLRSTMTGGYHCDPNNPPEWNVHRVGGVVESVRNTRLGSLKGLSYEFKYDFREGIQNFPDSVLVLGGSCSSLGYEMQKKYTVPHFRAAKAVEIKNAGHRMNIEKFDELTAALKSYLQEYQ